MTSRPATALGLIVLGCAAGCGSSQPTSADAPPVHIDAAPDAAALTITMTGTIHEWMSPTASGPVLADAMVCLYAAMPANCTTTDAAGGYTLQRVPAATNIGVVASKAGYLRTLVLIKSPMANPPPLEIAAVTDAVLQQKLVDAGGTYPLAGTAIAEVGAFAPSGNSYAPASGVTAGVTPASGRGPVYLGTDGYPMQSLTSTSAEGGVMFVNVTPGTVDVALTLTAATCAASQYDSWTGPTAGTVRVPADPDTLTYISVTCQ